MASERVQRRIERLLDQIEQEADQQNWQSVHDLCDEVLGLAPENSDAAAQRRLSSTEVQQGRVQPGLAPDHLGVGKRLNWSINVVLE